jgi:hypothetical protein
MVRSQVPDDGVNLRARDRKRIGGGTGAAEN